MKSQLNTNQILRLLNVYILLNQMFPIFVLKGQIVNIFALANHMVSVTTIQSCAKDCQYVNKWIWLGSN